MIIKISNFSFKFSDSGGPLAYNRRITNGNVTTITPILVGVTSWVSNWQISCVTSYFN